MRSSRWASIRGRSIKLSGIGCSSKSPAYFLGGVTRVQLRARPHAVGRHGRDARQPQADRHRRERRRRHRRDRYRPVRPPDAAQRPDRLHHRRQRVLRARRRGSSRRPPTSARRSRTASSTSCQPIDTCALAIELGASFVARSFSGDKKQLLSILKASLEPSRHVHDRRHLAVRDVQRSRGIDEELRLREGTRRAARRGELRAVFRRHHRRVRARNDASRGRCTTGRSYT